MKDYAKDRPNIFEYATKELSQDAMVCWLLKCCHSGNKKYKRIGYDFIKFILNDESLDDEDITLHYDSPHKQYYHMDVYANIRVKDTIVPVIFEDKTDTYLHGNQPEKYCSRVHSWFADKRYKDWRETLFDLTDIKYEVPYFVFIKIGYTFNWQKDELEKLQKTFENENKAKIRIILIDDMIDFISRHENDDVILNDYAHFLNMYKQNNNNSTAKKCDGYFTRIFGKTIHFTYNYQGWASKDIAIFRNDDEYRNIYYSLRTGYWKCGKEYRYGIVLQQYRNEKNAGIAFDNKNGLTSEKRENAQKIREICNDIINDLNSPYPIIMEFNDKNKMPDQNNILKIFFSDEEEVCNLIKMFLIKFRQAVSARFGAEVEFDKDIKNLS